MECWWLLEIWVGAHSNRETSQILSGALHFGTNPNNWLPYDDCVKVPVIPTPSYRQGKLVHKMCNSPRSPGPLLWLTEAAPPLFDSLTPLTFSEQPPRSGWLHRSMGWQENPSPSYPSMQMHLKSISTKGTQIEQLLLKASREQKSSLSLSSKNLTLISSR